MKKIVSLVLVCLLISALFIGCAQNQEKTKQEGNDKSQTSEQANEDNTKEGSQELEKMRVAYHPNMGGASAAITAQKMGYFEEEGLDVELVKFTSGPPEIAAMVSGDIDLGYIGFGAHFLAAQGKVNIIAIDNLGKADEILVHKDKGATKIEDLKGKTIATPLGTSGEILLDLALKKANMTKDDVKVVNMDVAGAVSAFVAKKVDAVCVWSPYTVEIKKNLGKDNVVMIANNLSFMPEYVFPSSWVTTPNYLKNNEEKAVKFVKALMKAADYRSKNIDQVVEWTAEFTTTPVDSVMQEKDSAEWIDAETIRKAFEDGTAKGWYEKQEQIFVNTGKLDNVVPVDDFLSSDTLLKAFK